MSIQRRRSAGIFMVVIAAVLAACGGSATPSLPAATVGATVAPTTGASANATSGESGTGTADPCALVTSAEAQAAMGVPVAKTTPKNDGTSHVCDYASADGRTDLEVTVIDPGPDAADKTTFDIAYGAGQPIAGVGGDAYFNAALNALSAWQNGTVVSVGVSNPAVASAGQVQAALTKVAIAVLARL